MGLWNWIKELFKLAIFTAWRWITEQFKPKLKSKPYEGQIRPGPDQRPPSSMLSPGGNPLYKPLQRIGDYLRQPFNRKHEYPNPIAPAYAVECPREYIKDDPYSGVSGYLGSSPYRTSIDNLYTHESLLYEKGKFKYRTQFNDYEKA